MLLLCLLCTSCLLYYLGFILWASWHFGQIKRSAKPQSSPSLSIMIPARNEADNIRECLLSALCQDYQGPIEVILINDQSTDDTGEIARSLQADYPHLRVYDLPSGERQGSKKSALSYGIHQAKGEIILQTDADCYLPETWASEMSAHFGGEVQLVSGPVLLTHSRHWLQSLQCLESIGLVVLGAGSLAGGKPNMANGANLAFRRQAFHEVGGYQGIDSVASGDDELLLQKFHAAYPGQLRFAKSDQAIVQTPALDNWSALKSQRLRWVSKARTYQNRGVNFVQLLSYLGFWSFPLCLLYGFWQWWGPLVALGLLLLKSIIDLVLMRKAAAFFHKLPLLRWLGLLELVYIPYVLWIGIAGNLVSRYEWKGRSVR